MEDAVWSLFLFYIIMSSEPRDWFGAFVFIYSSSLYLPARALQYIDERSTAMRVFLRNVRRYHRDASTTVDRGNDPDAEC